MFLSRYDNKLDRKGRVSVPASYRAVLASQSFQGIVAYPSPVNRAIEACGFDHMKDVAEGIARGFTPYSRERRTFARSLLSKAHSLQFDAEGRVMLPKSLIEYADLTDMVTFAGMGDTFELWDPAAYDALEDEIAADMAEQAPQLALPRQFGGGDA